jgi:aspartate racemase
VKTLGVLGGMGPAATLDFLARLQAATPAARDQDHIRVLVDINPHIPDRNTDSEAAGPVLGAMAKGLAGAGADVLAIACNTAHAWADIIREASGLPLIDMIDIACEAARDGGARRVGVLGTPTAVALYSARLKALGLEPVVPDAARQARFMELVYRIKAGDLGEDVRDGMAELAAGMDAEALIAGCTEVPLVLDPARLSVPLLDAGALLAARCVAVCSP